MGGDIIKKGKKMKEIKSIKLKYKEEKRNITRRCRARIRSLKRHEKFALSDYRLSAGKKPPVDPPKRSLIEEILNSATHGLGTLFSIVAFILMLSVADSDSERIGAFIYFGGMLLSFAMSCLYHAFPHGSAVKRLFRRFDYSSIYLLIGATFILPLLTVFDGVFRGIFIVVQWLAIAFGITLVAIFGPSRFRFIHIPLYVILGWSALMLLPGLVAYSAPLATFILLGGVSYTLGIIPFAIKIPYSHPLWHVFVLVGALLQWIGIYSYLL